MSTYLLVHGAWHGGWCWRRVMPLLEAKGHAVLAPDLPGHGEDKTPAATVTLTSYADAICKIAGAQAEPVILVGHSMGGMAVTQAAENCPASIAALVYLCAFLPRNGDSLSRLSAQDRNSVVNPTTTELQAAGSLTVKPEVRREAFYLECDDEDAALALSKLVDQPLAPLITPVGTTTERWGRIARYYIECVRDRAITIEAQREMQRQSPCRRTFSIETDHSPFLSAPKELAAILLQIERERA